MITNTMQRRGVVWGLAVLAASVLPALARAEDSNFQEQTTRNAMDNAVSKIAVDLSKTKLDIKRIAVIPLRNDTEDRYAEQAVKQAVTRSPYQLYARDEAEFNELVKEIEWNVRKEDVMDPEKVKKFGKIAGVDAIMYGVVWDKGVNMWSIRGHSKLTLNVANVETGQIVWSSGPVEGDAYIHWSDALTQFWRFPVVILIIFGVLMLFGLMLKALRRAYRPI